MRVRSPHLTWISLFLSTLSAACGGAGRSATSPEQPSVHVEPGRSTAARLPGERELAEACEAVAEKPATSEAREEAGVAARASAEEPSKRDHDGDSSEGGIAGGAPRGIVRDPIAPGATPPHRKMVIPFAPAAGMNQPVKISGADFRYAPEAISAGVEGLLIVRCAIRLDGVVINCRVLKSLPYLAEDVLTTLKTQRYTPILYQGRACNVDYVFALKFKLPATESRSPPRRP